MSAALTAERGRSQVLAELEHVRELLLAYADGTPAPARRRTRAGNSFDRLAGTFGLSAFERDVLALAVAVELDGELGALVTRLQGGTDPRPTFGLALAALPDPHWDALAPDRPLRRWRLVELGPGPTVATRALAVDEHILHWLTGIGGDDPALAGRVRPSVADALTDSQASLATELARTASTVGADVLIRLGGTDADARLAVAQRIAADLGATVLHLRPDPSTDPHVLARIVDRTARLHRRIPVVADDALADRLEAPVVITLAEGDALPGRVQLRRDVDLPDPAEQRAIWHDALGGSYDAVVEELAAHFRLPARTVLAVVAEHTAARGDADTLRRITRDRARSGLDGLAERIDLHADWDELVLPPGQVLLLRDIAAQVRHRTQVHERWGFGEHANRGLGVSALFTGESGTGKTMAAEVIANDLGLDLYRIDLSSVVSKYIGETEKNLRKLFDAAEGSGAVLLFDEADALFGKRGEVRDSHDRYANLEVAYLLQRMECYRGLAVLTTNLRSNVDRAFLRRLRFVVQFPFPDDAHRAEIWRRSFPERTPTERLDPAALARLQLSGGSIRNVALSAAFAAAEAGTAITPEHVLHAVRVEYAKSDRVLTASETAGLESR